MKYLTLVPTLIFLLILSTKVSAAQAEAGFSLGSPGAINVMYKTQWDGKPVQLTAGYSGDRYGIEAGYSFYFSESSYMRSWQAIIGSSRYEDKIRRFTREESGQVRSEYDDETWTYVGVSGTFRYGGFFIEPGLSVGTGDHSNPQLTLQIGWLWSL